MIYSYKCCIGGCEETQACLLEEVLTSLFIIFLQRTFLAFSHSIRLTNIGLANVGLADIRLANIGLANTGLVNTGLSAVAWERTPIPRVNPYSQASPYYTGFKTAFFQYQDWELGIKAARILKEKEDALETQADNKGDDGNSDSELSDVELYRTSPSELDTETELTRYLKLPVMERETNIYHYWKAKQFEFPIISKMAGDFLAIPTTSAPSERVFNVSSDVVTKKRNRFISVSESG